MKSGKQQIHFQFNRIVLEKLFSKNNSKNITTAFTVVVMLFLFIACADDNKNVVKSFPDRASVPVLRTMDVTTMVSDSGITRYRIKAPEWVVYDKAEEPYWDFPQGINFERFDGDYQTDANIVSDEAVYYEQKKLWELTGNVKATNIEGEKFETPKLFWNQENEKIYSDDSITIIQSDKIIRGKGFLSNQTLSKYEILKVSGIFPIEE